MLVAIPTINQKLITRRFGRMTEITFVEIENNEVKNQYAEVIISHHEHEGHHHHASHHLHAEHGHHEKHNNRHQEIKEKICKADTIIYRSLCKNWRERLSDCSTAMRRTNYDLLEEVIAEVQMFEH